MQRTPGATEKPVTGQFFARDDTGFGTIHYNGTQSGAPASVFLKVYTTDTGADVLYATHRQTLVGGAYAFTAPIAAGKETYKVVYGTTNSSGVDTTVSTITNLVCGDAYIIEGQSNAVATDGPPDDLTNSTWIRTYGQTGGTWGNAVRKGNDYWIGYWGFDLALTLSTTHNMPICIINGAVGGTRIDQHQANPANHATAGSLYSIYANLLNRVVGGQADPRHPRHLLAPGREQQRRGRPHRRLGLQVIPAVFRGHVGGLEAGLSEYPALSDLSDMAESLLDGRPGAQRHAAGGAADLAAPAIRT